MTTRIQPAIYQEPLEAAVTDPSNTEKRLRSERIWFWILRANNLLILGMLALIMWFLLSRGLGKALSWEFLSQMPREAMTEGGVLPAIVGTLLLTVVAMAVATVKASLVVLFFMHLKYDEPFNGLIFVGTLIFLGIFIVLTMADFQERGRVNPIEAREIQPVPASSADPS